jgi:hypothetical protein
MAISRGNSVGAKLVANKLIPHTPRLDTSLTKWKRLAAIHAHIFSAVART